MATWGASNRRSRSDGQVTVPRDETPVTEQYPRRRDVASADLRDAVDGREHEFWGIGFIVVGVLLGLGIYFSEQAGPLGRGVATLVGWFTGLGRFVVPVGLVTIGIALVRRGHGHYRARFGVGWGLGAIAILGVLHIARGPDKIMSGFDDLGRAGGWLGALVGEPLQRLLDTVGAVIVCAAIFLGAVLLVTGASLRTLASESSRGVGSVLKPMGRRVRESLDDLSSLDSERDDVVDEPIETVTPQFYDPATDDEWAAPSDPLLPPKKPRVAKPKPEPAAEQAELDLGPAAQRGNWTLPPMNSLSRTGAHTIDKAEVERRGRTLVDSLASHGVETKLVGQTVGPTVTRYELELGVGVKVARITSLTKDIAYAMAATDVRILAPIPGRTAIGVEVPNHTRQLVSLGDILTSPESKTATHPLEVGIGKDIAGRSVFLNLATMPHLLIAGTTG